MKVNISADSTQSKVLTGLSMESKNKGARRRLGRIVRREPGEPPGLFVDHQRGAADAVLCAGLVEPRAVSEYPKLVLVAGIVLAAARRPRTVATVGIDPSRARTVRVLGQSGQPVLTSFAVDGAVQTHRAESA